MPVALAAFIGSIAGLHAACYGAYKDSPHETFMLPRFVREIVIAIIIAGVLSLKFFSYVSSLPPAVFFLIVLAWSRGIALSS